MSISSVSSTSSAVSTSSSSSSSSSSVLGDFNSMLTLLLKQLETQDPTSPMDTSTYTSQLVSMSQLEQQSKTNDLLTEMQGSLSGLMSSNVAYGYLGQTVEVEGDTAPLQNGTASWKYDLPSGADDVTVTITDANGNKVYSGEAPADAGTNSFTWDGTLADGSKATSGAFTLSVTASSDNVSSKVDPRAIGKVTSVDSSSGTVALSLGTVTASMNDVVNLA
ncbi:flagellar hook assembly protein FlgD [Niveispirillum irakense]|uniref:flagellar hook assembly protein FlgD n=1 Tax=Niveispirillum irakense TaxID=34011 RepID=UPI0004904ED5|nr:flagellar hook capping FlgD N-terminal domain-containing protein [Niveispirillum irakense]